MVGLFCVGQKYTKGGPVLVVVVVAVAPVANHTHLKNQIIWITKTTFLFCLKKESWILR